MLTIAKTKLNYYFEPSKAMLLNVGNEHAYMNDRKEDRYDIIVHGVKTKEYEKLVIRSYEKTYG